MKIAFLDDRIHAYAAADPGVAGGAERQQWLLARALAASGEQVVCGVRNRLTSGVRTHADNVEFVGLGAQHWARAWIRFLATERPDWLYWRSADHLLGPVVELARRFGIKTVFAAAFDTDVTPRAALARRRRWWPLYAWGLERADRILVQHRGQLAALGPRWRRKAFVVPGLAGRLMPAADHAARGRDIAWVGMLREPKRPDLLVRIARALPDERFVVCGGASAHRTDDGYSRAVIEDLRRLPNVCLLGQVPPPAAMRTIAASALLLSTADREGFPNTFLQAWASGTPVVTLTIDPDQVIERLGLGVVSRTVERAVVDIAALLASTDVRQQIGARSRRHVEMIHSDAAVTRGLNRALRTEPSPGRVQASTEASGTKAAP